jgi:hypothetical protein
VRVARHGEDAGDAAPDAGKEGLYFFNETRDKKSEFVSTSRAGHRHPPGSNHHFACGAAPSVARS